MLNSNLPYKEVDGGRGAGFATGLAVAGVVGSVGQYALNRYSKNVIAKSGIPMPSSDIDLGGGVTISKNAQINAAKNGLVFDKNQGEFVKHNGSENLKNNKYVKANNIIGKTNTRRGLIGAGVAIAGGLLGAALDNPNS